MIRKKGFFSVLIFSLITCLLLSNVQIINASQQNTNAITILLNGEKLTFDVEPYIKEGRTLVPFRGILEALGAEVIWNPDEKSVTTKSDTTEIYLKIGSNETYVNGDKVIIDVAAEITNSRTFVPLRFISENLGATVLWDGDTRTVSILYEDKTIIEQPIIEQPIDEEVPGSSGGNNSEKTVLELGDVFDNGDFKIIIEKVEMSSEDEKLYIIGKVDFNGNRVYLAVQNINEYIEYAFYDSVGNETGMKSFKASADWKSTDYAARKIIIGVYGEGGNKKELAEINI